VSRPLDLPPAERYRHGTRSRYVAGCRCDPCRAANTAAYHERQARAKAAAAELPAAAATPAPQEWTGPDGVKRVRVYKRACPGVNGEPCPIGAHLRKDSKGGCCRACREKLVWNGLVDAGPARAHLLALSAQGVGRRSVEAACDVANSLLEEIKTGRKARIRKKTADRILSVDVGAVADHGLVSARETWGLIEQLLELGCTRKEIARRLGSIAATPALQLRRGKVLAITQARVRKVYWQIALELKRQLDLRDEIQDAGELGAEWFDAEAFSIIQRKGRPEQRAEVAG
jgi:hypothetical protein